MRASQVPSGSNLRLSLLNARKRVAERISGRGGHRDRKSGAFAMPEDDMSEPERSAQPAIEPQPRHSGR